MSNISYQNINRINISNNEIFEDRNNQIDTTGRINEKLYTKFNKGDVIKSNEQPIINDDKVYSTAKTNELFVKKEEEDLVKLTNTNTSLITNGDIKIQTEETQPNNTTITKDNIILSKDGSFKSNNLTVGEVAAFPSENKKIPFNPLWYGETDKGLYILKKEFDENNQPKTTIIFISNQSLDIPYKDINIDIGTKYFDVVSAGIFENNLYLLILYKSYQSDTNIKDITLVFNENINISQYKDVIGNVYISNIGYGTGAFLKNIYMNNNTDMYFVYNYKIFLLFYRNNQPVKIYLEKEFPINYTYNTIYNIHYIQHYLFILCDNGCYIYDTVSDTNNLIFKNYNFNDGITNHIYNYSMYDNGNIYIKYKDLNHIYKLNDNDPTNPNVNLNIDIFTNNNKFINSINTNNNINEINYKSVSHFKISNNIIYFIEEDIIGPPNNQKYQYTFYKYDIKNNEYSYKKLLGFYTLSNRYNSTIPLYQINSFVFLYETPNIIDGENISRNNAEIIFPLMEVLTDRIHIKNFVINDNEIVLAAKNVIIPQNLVGNKIVNKEIIMKSTNELYIKNLYQTINYINLTTNILTYYYQNSKALFYITKINNNDTKLYAYVYQTNKFTSISITSATNYETFLSATVYNDLLYILLSKLENSKEILYLRICDIIKDKNNNYIISIVKNDLLITKKNINDNDFIPNKYFYCPCIIIPNSMTITSQTQTETITTKIDVLYVYNSYDKGLYKFYYYNNSLIYEYIDTLNTIQTINLPSNPENGINYSTVKQILNISNDLYFIYYELFNNNSQSHEKLVPKYNVYVFKDIENQYNIDIRINEDNTDYINFNKGIYSDSNDQYFITQEDKQNVIPLINYSLIYNDNLYFNIINQNNMKVRGIYYINNFIRSYIINTENPNTTINSFIRNPNFDYKSYRFKLNPYYDPNNNNTCFYQINLKSDPYLINPYSEFYQINPSFEYYKSNFNYDSSISYIHPFYFNIEYDNTIEYIYPFELNPNYNHDDPNSNFFLINNSGQAETYYKLNSKYNSETSSVNPFYFNINYNPNNSNNSNFYLLNPNYNINDINNQNYYLINPNYNPNSEPYIVNLNYNPNNINNSNFYKLNPNYEPNYDLFNINFNFNPRQPKIPRTTDNSNFYLLNPNYNINDINNQNYYSINSNYNLNSDPYLINPNFNPNDTNNSNYYQINNDYDPLAEPYIINPNYPTTLSNDIYPINPNPIPNNSNYPYIINPNYNSSVSRYITNHNYTMYNNYNKYFDNYNYNNTVSKYIINEDYDSNIIKYEPYLYPTKELKVLDLFKNEAYSFNVLLDKWFVITTQNHQIINRIERYDYVINYYDKSEDILQKIKFLEKNNFSKYGLVIPPLILDNIETLLVDSNKKYNLFLASLFSNILNTEKNILNTNTVITSDFVRLFNNLYVNGNVCKVESIAKDNNDIINKKYLDDNKPGLKKIYQFDDPNNSNVKINHYGEIFNNYNDNIASGNFSSAFGYNTISSNDFMFSIGKYNDNSDPNILFSVGNGYDDENRLNAFCVKTDNKAYAENINTTGADYAELYETYNPSITKEQFKGHFITLINDKVKIASNTDDYILGVYSYNSSILGNNPIDWHDKYLKNDNNEIIYENIKQLKPIFNYIENKKINNIELTYEEFNLDINTNINDKFEFIKVPKINPNYDPSVNYINRINRDEWIPVGLLGKLLVIDNGLCEVNKYCKVAADGTAEPYVKEINGNIPHWRVIKRFNDTKIFIIFK